MKLGMLVVGALALAPLPAAVAKGKEDVDLIVARVIAAQGGREKLAAVRSRRETGRMVIDPDVAGPLVVELKRPGKMRMELTLNGKTLVRTYDGAAGWQINPFGASGAAAAVALSPEELVNISEEADFDGPLVDYKARGNQVELGGQEKVDGSDAYKLKVTLKSGDVDYYYFDAGSYRKVKWQGTRHQNGKEAVYETVFHDYRAVGGLLFPFRIDSGNQGAPPNAHIILAAIELDPVEEDARFGKPAAAPPAQAPPPAARRPTRPISGK
jgi:hypothetical protein